MNKSKSFKEQFIECGDRGYRIKVKCLKCQQELNICLPYRGICQSKLCKEARRQVWPSWTIGEAFGRTE